MYEFMCMDIDHVHVYVFSMLPYLIIINCVIKRGEEGVMTWVGVCGVFTSSGHVYVFLAAIKIEIEFSLKFNF